MKVCNLDPSALLHFAGRRSMEVQSFCSIPLSRALGYCPPYLLDSVGKRYVLTLVLDSRCLRTEQDRIERVDCRAYVGYRVQRRWLDVRLVETVIVMGRGESSDDQGSCADRVAVAGKALGK